MGILVIGIFNPVKGEMDIPLYVKIPHVVTIVYGFD